MSCKSSIRRALGWSAPLVLVAGALSVAGCHSREPQSPQVGLTDAVVPPRNPDLPRGEPRREVDVLYNIYLGDPLRDSCKGPAPFFEFDSSNAKATGQPTMQVLADCMLSGPLKDKSIRLIGHTDPRGASPYNATLGRERARRVRSYLVTQGVPGDRIQIESAGESTASGAPADWPTDRRVEIQLVLP